MYSNPFHFFFKGFFLFVCFAVVLVVLSMLVPRSQVISLGNLVNVPLWSGWEWRWPLLHVWLVLKHFLTCLLSVGTSPPSLPLDGRLISFLVANDAESPREFIVLHNPEIQGQRCWGQLAPEL